MSEIKNTTNKKDKYPIDLYVPKHKDYLNNGVNSGLFGFYNNDPKLSMNDYIQDKIDNNIYEFPIDLSINLGNVWFVSDAAGLTADGEKGNLHKPFRHWIYLYDMLEENDIVVILPGNYPASDITDPNLTFRPTFNKWKPNVTYYFMTGSYVELSSSYPMFPSSELNSNSKIRILGGGDFDMKFAALIDPNANFDTPFEEVIFSANTYKASNINGQLPCEAAAYNYFVNVNSVELYNAHMFYQTNTYLDASNCNTIVNIGHVFDTQSISTERPFWASEYDTGSIHNNLNVTVNIGAYHYNRTKNPPADRSAPLWNWGRKKLGDNSIYTLNMNALYCNSLVPSNDMDDIDTNSIVTFGYRSASLSNNSVFNYNFGVVDLHNHAFINLKSMTATNTGNVYNFNAERVYSDLGRLFYSRSLTSTDTVNICFKEAIVDNPIMAAIYINTNSLGNIFITDSKIKNNGAFPVIDTRQNGLLTIKNSVLLNDGTEGAITSIIGGPYDVSILDSYTNSLISDVNIVEKVTPLIKDINVK